MSNSTSVSTRNYCYFNPQGYEIGRSSGDFPDPGLFKQSHYVIADQIEMLKNGDPLDVIEADIQEHTKLLINTPIAKITEILYLNKLISALKNILTEKQKMKQP